MKTIKRFKKVKGGWKDTQTGLVWGPTSRERMDWQAAQAWCAAQGDGWRCPTSAELMAVIDHGRRAPATDLPGTQSYSYWSSTTYQGNPAYAWDVNFYDGYVLADGKSFFTYVRAVRAGFC